MATLARMAFGHLRVGGFPPATLGMAYYLPPDLQEKIRAACFAFDLKSSALQAQFQASGAVKFVPVVYKQDFALIRRIDDAFRRPTVATATKTGTCRRPSFTR